MNHDIRVKEVSIADKPAKSRDNLMFSIKHNCPSCENDKFTLFGGNIMIAPIGEQKSRGYVFSLTGICTKCSHTDAINITRIIDKVFTPSELKELIQECYPS